MYEYNRTVGREPARAHTVEHDFIYSPSSIKNDDWGDEVFF